MSPSWFKAKIKELEEKGGGPPLGTVNVSPEWGKGGKRCRKGRKYACDQIFGAAIQNGKPNKSRNQRDTYLHGT